MKSLEIPCKLATAPKNRPKYFTTVTNVNGDEVILSDPTYNRALLGIMNMNAVNGGAACHWGGPSAMAEVMSALHGIMFSKSEKWFEHFNFVNDMGHAENGIYALRANYGFGGLEINDLWGFRSIESKLTGHGESHLYPEGVLLSNGPLGSSIPQAQGLCLADKLMNNDRVTVCSISDGACMEGEAKEAISAIAGLANKGKLNPFLLLVSDNNTKLSGRIDDDAFSMGPTFNSFSELGWDTRVIEDGHDLEACYLAIESALNELSANKPIALIFKTIKGKAIASTEKSASGGHGFPVKPYSPDIISFMDEIFSGNTPSDFAEWTKALTEKPESSSEGPAKEKAQAGLGRGAIKAASEGLPVYSVSSDLQGSTGMAAFQKAFPENYTDLGVAEANMVSTGAGLSKAGFIPIVDTFAAFGVTKGNLPLIMANLSEAPVIAVFSHTGFQDAADGASHQSLTYISALCSIPNTDLVVISCAAEGEALMYQAIKKFADDRNAGHTPRSTVFFVGRENFVTSIDDSIEYSFGACQILNSGSDVTIASCGPLIHKALEAAAILKEKGISVEVINNNFVNNPDIKIIGESVAKTKKLLTIEDHQITGGMGALLVHSLKTHGASFSLKSLGVKGKFGQSSYQADHLYALHKVDTNSIVDEVVNWN